MKLFEQYSKNSSNFSDSSNKINNLNFSNISKWENHQFSHSNSKINNNNKNLVINSYNRKTSLRKSIIFGKIDKINLYKFNLIKKILNDSKKKSNIEDINYILESPHRGIEKIEFQKPNIYTYIKSSSILNKRNYSFKLQNHRYKSETTKPNKEIKSPLKELSNLSGMSTTLVRHIINFSLKNKEKLKMIKKNIFDLDKKKVFYSKSSLKPKEKMLDYKLNSIKQEKDNINNYMESPIPLIKSKKFKISRIKNELIQLSI